MFLFLSFMSSHCRYSQGPWLLLLLLARRARNHQLDAYVRVPWTATTTAAALRKWKWFFFLFSALKRKKLLPVSAIKKKGYRSLSRLFIIVIVRTKVIRCDDDEKGGEKWTSEKSNHHHHHQNERLVNWAVTLRWSTSDLLKKRERTRKRKRKTVQDVYRLYTAWVKWTLSSN